MSSRVRLPLRWFTFFFVCIGSIRLWEIFYAPSGFSFLGTCVVLCHITCVALGLTLLRFSSRRLSLVALAALSILYLASEHHFFVQGAYLTSRELVHYSVFSPQLFHGYWSNIYWPVLIAALCVLGASLALFCFQLPFERQLPAAPTLKHRTTSGVVTLTFFGTYIHLSSGPLATFCLPLLYALLPLPSNASETFLQQPFLTSSVFPSADYQTPRKVSAGNEKLNVILIHLESTGDLSGRDDGASFVTSRDRLARTGLSFTNAYAPAPHTGKSIFASQTGRYGPAKVSNPINTLSRERHECITNNFKKAGYRTGFFAANYFHFYGIARLKEVCDYDQMSDARQLGKTDPTYINGLGTDEEALFTQALKWMDESKQPFFITLQTVLPHWPYTAPPSWSSPAVSKEDRLQQYRNSLSYVDHALNRFLDELEKRSLIDNTVIVLFGDHGEAFSEHPNNLIHGAELYEENVRIPLIISNPKLIPEASSTNAVASLVDLPPTLFDIFGMPWDPGRFDGVSLFGAPPNRMVFMVSDMLGDKYGLRDGDFKFIESPAVKNSASLFNLREDPKESKNLSSLSADRRDFYSKAIESWVNHTRRHDPQAK